MGKRVTTLILVNPRGEPRGVVTHVTSPGRARHFGIREGLIGNDGDTVPYHEVVPRYGKEELKRLRRLDCRKSPKLPPNYQLLDREFHPLKSIDQIPRPKAEQLQLFHWVPPA